ncbi:hypothetical protein GCM10011515_21710 [Tsuneonella deserti]|uniref:GGDEF domain-containing protein n=1 Tax=Tsuneonella deserti TaxID=2035528 RepID=A0ABQ1S940_9SPHN|nr:DUF5985 family protein [Tsuneonella deserti]GGE01651.1 hypothetical protein GCM10011515_21710 [Tsuneonella deserti]
MITTFADLVYLLCFFASALCAALLVRRYAVSSTPILLWSAACFVFLALSNLLVVVDQMVLTEVSFRTPRLVLTLMAVSVLLFGFIWEVERD